MRKYCLLFALLSLATSMASYSASADRGRETFPQGFYPELLNPINPDLKYIPDPEQDLFETAWNDGGICQSLLNILKNTKIEAVPGKQDCHSRVITHNISLELFDDICGYPDPFDPDMKRLDPIEFCGPRL